MILNTITGENWKTQPNSHDAPAFTLIELLVVIAIIGVLIALLMPALAKARESARGIQCGNKLHQMAIGVTMYLGDNNDVTMSTFYNNGPPYTLPNVAQWWLGRILGRYLIPKGHNRSMDNINVGDRHVYDCPTNPSAGHRIDYAMSRHTQWQRASDLKGDLIMFAENRQIGTEWKISFNWPGTSNFKHVGYWHNPPGDQAEYVTSDYIITFPSGASNVLHIGGHVSRQKSKNLQQLAKP